MKLTWPAIIFLLLWCHQAQAQYPIEIMRESKVELYLKGKELGEIKIAADSLDYLKLVASAGIEANFKLISPDGRVLREALIKDRKQWSYEVEQGGDYTVVLENTNKFLPIRAFLNVSLSRPDFSIGYPTDADSLKIPGDAVQLLTAESDIIKANPKSYPVDLKKGDTLNVVLKPLKGRSPLMQIKSGKEEILWASLRKKDAQRVTIPVLNDDTYTIEISTDALLKHPYQLSLDKVTPTKYRAPILKDLVAEKPVQEDPAVVLYDTIPEVFIDTVLHLAARRNILRRYEQKFPVQLADTTNVMYWGILYGVGKDFETAMEKFEPVLAGETFQAVGATDVLSAYGLGLLEVLPGTTTRCLTVKISADIRENFTGTRPNYALIEPSIGTNYLYFNNECESIGQRVYLKAVVFKKNEK